MFVEKWKLPETLLDITINHICHNLSMYYKSNDLDSIRNLPPHVKDKLSHKFLTGPYFWRGLDFKETLSCLLNSGTKQIDLTSAELDDDLLEILTVLSNVRKLYLCRTTTCGITSSGLTNLFQYTKHVFLLRISGCKVFDDEALISLAKNCPNLAGLEASHTSITDEGLIAMSEMANLTWLTFSNTLITDKGVIALVKGKSGSKMKEMRIDNCQHITDKSLQAISQYCPNIQILVFYNCAAKFEPDRTSAIQEGNWKHLKQLTYTITW